MTKRKIARAAGVAVAALTLGACAQKVATVSQSTGISHTAADRECMARAMYFESHRTGDQGMLAVGTVVANRLASGQYGRSVCDVVAAKRQFAPGVMTRQMTGAAAENARRNADAVLGGKRHPGVKRAMHFHTAGLRFPYPNMHYVLVAGGNAFYEKHDGATAHADNARSRALALAYARVNPAGDAKPIQVASLSPSETPRAASATVAARPAEVTTVAARDETVQPLAYARPEPAPAFQIKAPAPRPAVSQPSLANVAEPKAEKVARAPAAKRVIEPAKSAPALAAAVPTPAPASAPSEPAQPASPVAAANVAAAFAAFE